MIKKNKIKLIIVSVITLLPMLLGIIGKAVPRETLLAWGIFGDANVITETALFFLIIPPILVALHWLLLFLSSLVEKNQSQNPRIEGISIWMMPCISLFVCGILFFVALGYTSRIHSAILAVLAITFIFIGNYMPKTARNLTMGIKIRWALASDENWNATHRFAGKVYVGAGVLCIVGMFLPLGTFLYILFGVILVTVFLPVLYSYLFYKRQLAQGQITPETVKEGYREVVKNPKATKITSAVLIAVLAIGLPILLFTGKVETSLGEEKVSVSATFWGNLELSYDEIDSVEYRAGGVGGDRIAGYASAKLLLGTFRSDELGVYTRYTYAKNLPCIVLKANGKTFVIGGKTAEETKAIYDHILAEISE